MEIKNVFVVGSGLMGSGIAQVSAFAGYKVKMHDVKEEFTAPLSFGSQRFIDLTMQ